MAADYIVTWYYYSSNTSDLGWKDLPILGKELTDFLMSEKGFNEETVPNSIQARKGPLPTTVYITVPYSEINNFSETGTNEIKIVVQSNREDEIPSQEIIFKNLYVTDVTETIVDSITMSNKGDAADNDLIIITLKDIRHHFLDKSGYGASIGDDGTLKYNDLFKASEELWDNELKPLYNNTALTNTNEFRPEDGTNHLQFIAEIHKDNYQVFNEVLNRTENVFFIDKDGTPIVQKYSYIDANVATDLVSFISDAFSTDTLQTNSDVTSIQEWRNITGYFWYNNARDEFITETKAFSTSSLADSDLPIFPITQRQGASQNPVQEYKTVLNNYKTEILLARNVNATGLERFRFFNNIDFEFKSEITHLRYTNNYFGVFTYVDMSYRHGIPFHKHVADFKRDTVPSASQNFHGNVPRDNKTSSPQDGKGSTVYSRYSIRGFSGDFEAKSPFQTPIFSGDVLRNASARRLNATNVKTNDLSRFGSTDGITITKEGWYNFAFSGHTSFNVIESWRSQSEWCWFLHDWESASGPDPQVGKNPLVIPLSGNGSGPGFQETQAGTQGHSSHFWNIPIPNPTFNATGDTEFERYPYMCLPPEEINADFTTHVQNPYGHNKTAAGLSPYLSVIGQWLKAVEDRNSPTGKRWQVQISIERATPKHVHSNASAQNDHVDHYQQDIKVDITFNIRSILGYHFGTSSRRGMGTGRFLFNDTQTSSSINNLISYLCAREKIGVVLVNRATRDILGYSAGGKSPDNAHAFARVRPSDESTVWSDDGVPAQSLIDWPIMGSNFTTPDGFQGGNWHHPEYTGKSGVDQVAQSEGRQPSGKPREIITPFTKTGIVYLEKGEVIDVWAGIRSEQVQGGHGLFGQGNTLNLSTVISNLSVQGNLRLQLYGKSTDVHDI